MVVAVPCVKRNFQGKIVKQSESEEKEMRLEQIGPLNITKVKAIVGNLNYGAPCAAFRSRSLKPRGQFNGRSWV